MPIPIPYYCSNCGTWRSSPLALADGAQNVTIGGFSIQCGQCQQPMQMVEGIYSTVKGVLEVIESHNLSKKELKKLSRIMQNAIARNTPAGQLREIIERDVSNASGITKYLRDGKNLRVDLQIILTILGLILAAHLASPDADQIAEKVAERLVKEGTPTQQSVMPGVNAPCWCGSGNKQKKCHGSTAPPQTKRKANQKPR